MRGESIIAFTGLAVASIFLLSIAGAGAWTVHVQRSTERDQTRGEIESCGRLLVRGAEPLLAAGELSEARAMLVAAAVDHSLSICQIRLADGKIVADSSPGKSVPASLPPVWPQGPVPAAPHTEPGAVTFTAPVVVPGRGEAYLTISRRPAYSLMSGWEAQTGIGVIGALGFIAVWGVYRNLRTRLRAVGAIREALLALQRGETAGAALAVSAGFGVEAAAWNELIGERDRLRAELLSERAKESLNARQDIKTDLAQACDALWQGLIVLDDQLKVRYLNGAAAVFLRAKREALAGAAIGEFLQDGPAIEAIRSVASGGIRRRTTVEIRRTEAEGGGILRVSVRPVRRDDSAAALVVIEDVTQQRIADESRNAFVAQATHELRTPLTNIRLYVEQAIESGEDKAVRTKALDVINQECRRLERIVGDMLSVSEIEAGSFKLRAGDVRLEHMFDDLRDEYEPQARDKNLALSFALPPKLPVIQGDRDKIVLALHNLIGNALKYTPAGGKVDVKVDADERRLEVQVADTGIGISPEETELVFERFYRAKDKRVADVTGTGLGLALAREVVRLHGGDISVRSQLDHGTTFTMTLPTRAEAA